MSSERGKKYITALIVPSFEALEEYCEKQGIPFTSREELVARPDIIDFFRQRIDTLTKDLARFEKIKKFTLLPREFTMDSGEITPTLKVRRNVIQGNYKDVIDAMYAEVPNNKSQKQTNNNGQNSKSQTKNITLGRVWNL